MNSAKTNIMQRLKSANAGEPENIAPRYTPWGHENTVSEADKVSRFVDALTASHAEVITIDAVDLSQTIASVGHQKGIKTVAIGTEGEFIRDFHLGVSDCSCVTFSDNIESWKTTLFNDIDVGITHVLAGIADTGAIALWPSEHEPRTLSLIPPCHIAVMKQSTLLCNFVQLMEEQHWAISMPTNALLISGPSKTADIQQTLAYGAHGPSELVVILIEDK